VTSDLNKASEAKANLTIACRS